MVVADRVTQAPIVFFARADKPMTVTLELRPSPGGSPLSPMLRDLLRACDTLIASGLTEQAKLLLDAYIVSLGTTTEDSIDASTAANASNAIGSIGGDPPPTWHNDYPEGHPCRDAY
jgi:hypothetical protein